MTADTDTSYPAPPGTVARFARRVTGLLGLGLMLGATWLGYKVRFEYALSVIEIGNMQITWLSGQAQWVTAIGLFALGAILTTAVSQ